MKNTTFLRLITLVLFTFTLAAITTSPITPLTPVAAQSDPPDQATCTAETQAALQAILTALPGTCAEIAEGEACVAHETVTSSSLDPAATDTLAQAGDRANLAAGQTLHTSAYDSTTGDWGIALLQPTASPAPLWLLLAGDAQMTYNSWTDFHVQTATDGDAACSAEQPSLTLYSTGQHSLTLNHAAITLDAALVVIRQPTLNSLAFAVHQGQVSVVGGPIAGPGQTLVAVTDNDANIIFWSAPRAHYAEETEQAAATTQALNALSGVAVAVGAPASTCQPRTHTVQPGEWLFSIARQYDVSPESIVAANALADPNKLLVGQQLTIPCPPGTSTASAQPVAEQTAPTCANNPTHRVTQGETVFRIALRYGVTVDAIVAANNLPNAGLIYVGQLLVIPCGVDSGASAVAPAAQSGTSDTAQPPNTESYNEPDADFCAQNWGMIPFDVQSFIDQLCAQ